MMAHLHNGILLGYKKEEHFTLCNSIDEPGEHHTKWNKSVRETQIPYDFTHIWNRIKWTNWTSKENWDSLIDRKQDSQLGGS